MKSHFLRIVKSIFAIALLTGGIALTSCHIPSDVKLYTITFDSDGGSEVAFQRIYEGTKVSQVKSPKKEGYGFEYWTLDGKEFDFNTKIYKDITLKAYWKLLYTVNLDTDGGQVLANLKIKDGYKASLPTPKKAGRKFLGWYTDSTYSTIYDKNLPVTSNFTLYAKWETNKYPNPYKFNDGRIVQTKEEWAERAEELYNDYQTEMYGMWRSGETVTYTIRNDETDASVKYIDIEVSVNNDKKVSLPNAKVRLPSEEGLTPPDENGWPFVLGLSSGVSEDTALENGYAFIAFAGKPFEYNGMVFEWGGITDIAADDNKHTGLFYQLYPYDDANPESQTGELMAWGWGLSKIIDALYDGAAKELGINKENSIVTGVSRYGKAAAVCGTYERRIKMVAPGCSGAGGMASYRYFSEDMTYDLSSVGASSSSVWTANEPLGSLQADGEQGWFNHKFRSYKTPEDFELDQYMLAAINADPNRYFVILGAASRSDDWVNAPAMYLSFRAAETIYDWLGLGDHIFCYFHDTGHAVTPDDMQYLIDLFNDKVYKQKTKIAPYSYEKALKTSVFEEAVNYDPLYDSIDEQWEHPESNERNHNAKLAEIRSGSAELYAEN